MRAWENRPAEIASLLNPAFCSLILAECVSGYTKESKSGFPVSLCFAALPMVLHKPTRGALPGSVSTKLHSWIHKNRTLQIGFHKRAKDLVPHTWEAIAFGMSAGLFTVSSGGELECEGERKKRKLPAWSADSEPVDCAKASHFVGRWLARIGDESTVFAMLGIMP